MASQRRHTTKKRDRGRFAGLYKGISALVILAAVVAACAIFFQVQEISIQGNRRYSREEILNVIGVKIGDNLFQVNRNRVARNLKTRLPYIQTVTVSKVLPDTLSITVTEGQGAAAVAYENRWWILGSDGKLLEERDDAQGLPQVTGISPLAPAAGTYLAAGEEQAERVASLQELLAGLEDNGLLDKLSSVDLSQDYEIVFVYDDRFTVHMNPALEKGLSYWLQRFARALEQPAVEPNQPYEVNITNGKELRFIPI